MAEALPVPVFASLNEIYPSKTSVLREGTRWNDLLEAFKERYGALPTHVVRAPGRVNILGEHIDYSLFPVLPAAIEQDILLALRPIPGSSGSGPKVDLSNFNPKFKPSTFPLQAPASGAGEWHVDFTSPAQGGGWENYVKVAFAQCLSEFFGEEGKGGEGNGPVGMQVMMSGSVPPGSGLSSSAAVVVGAVTTFLVANGIIEGVTKGDVTRLAIASEHRMGLRTGGMDQAASALALPNSLLHLSFFPSLSPLPLPLPSGLSVVITNSLTPHSLTDTAPVQYNLRVVESICAARVLLHAWGLSEHERVKGKKGEDARVWLREVLEMWRPGKVDDETAGVLEEAVEAAEKVLGAKGRGERGWTREEMREASGMEEGEFDKTYLDFIPIRADHFHLLPRVLHCLRESQRVTRFTQICRSFSTPSAADGDASSDPRIAELGKLLVESHTSCKELYDCTHAQTDALKELCMNAGAIGSRQTGGGWGGAVISLVHTSQAEAFLGTVKEEYGPYKGLSEEKLHEEAFATIPGCGAGVYLVEGDLQ
ncbi:ribosomal protein S5 domain 2-type protein [Dioszegia hungarica]|uniref:Galactokinase n=1 Tax=Dioszegia hungarica TaxID=4972 RepID=A0AA38HEN1_9TREE|nr:ribosomal protein S5 domain 2-type protein [Dioszegia hungarica]KAI9637939.1 ribosomal protein S5 domain 2-type protein [Dioszegia hungarica]